MEERKELLRQPRVECSKSSVLGEMNNHETAQNVMSLIEECTFIKMIKLQRKGLNRRASGA